MKIGSWALSVAAVAVGFGGQQAAGTPADQLFTRLAIETAADGDLPPVQLQVNGRVQCAIYDRFRLTALAARAALLAGHPLDPAAPPADVLVPHLVVLAFAASPMGGDGPRPQSVKISDRNGNDVKQSGLLTSAELRALLPGVVVPPQTLAVTFALPSLRATDRIAVVFNDAWSARATLTPTNPMPGHFSGSVVVTAPKGKDTPPAVAPPGFTS